VANQKFKPRTMERIQFIKNNHDYLTIDELSEAMGLSRTAVIDLAKKAGIADLAALRNRAIAHKLSPKGAKLKGPTPTTYELDLYKHDRPKMDEYLLVFNH